MTIAEEIAHCVKIMNEGGIILYPTDTIWGIGCNAHHSAALEKIYSLKQRPSQKNFILLLANWEQLQIYVPHLPESLQDEILQRRKPTTIVYPNVVGLSTQIRAADGSIAIRVTEDDFCKKLIENLDAPLVSTSANTSGKPSPKNYFEIAAEIKNGVDYICLYRQDDTTERPASDIFKLLPNNELLQIR